MLLQVSAASFGYDDKLILDGLDLTVEEGDRIGLVGSNGAGKTTLLKLMLGVLSPTSGEVFCKRRLTVGYLAQNSGLESEKDVFSEMKSVFEETERAIDRQREIEKQLSVASIESAEYRRLSAEYNALTSVIDAKDGYHADVRIKTVLGGMGFHGRYDQIVGTMSGGEKTRLALAKLLLENPELLILDEPTNHLDFQTLAFLEEYLSSFQGALVIVSHDRYFLDKMVTRIWDCENGTVYPYRGNYSKYKITKAERLKNAVKEYEKQREKIAAMQDYAARNIVRATTSKSAKSRLHQLEHITPLEKPITYVKPPQFRFETDAEAAKVVLSVAEYPLCVGEKTLCKSVDLEIQRGERVALIGANGTGKSTLMRALRQNADTRIRFGKYVKVGYYDQENLNLDFSNTVLDELWGKFHLRSQTEIRAILARMLLGEEDMQKQVGMLSGGERAKLGFALVMAERGNVLLLDEPTNHLDLAAREALEDALKTFEGTVLFVSHDRYFLNAIATRTVELTADGLLSYGGNYDAYLKARADEKQTVVHAPAQPKQAQKGGYRSAKERAAEVKRKQDLQRVEKEISELEAEQVSLNETISTPEIASDFTRLSEYLAKLETLRANLEEKYALWETLAEE